MVLDAVEYRPLRFETGRADSKPDWVFLLYRVAEKERSSVILEDDVELRLMTVRM